MYRGVARPDRVAAGRGNVADSMGISLKPEHLKRYSQIARLMMKYGRSDLVKHAGLDEALTDEAVPEEAAAPPEAHELAEDLEKLGPTFIKLGQLLSTRVDIVPVAYAEALSRLQDDVEPFPSDEVERIVEEELGVRISKAFAEFEIQPMAAASLGQVHRAKLRDGRPVAVKVQRPGIREVVMHDMEALEELADFMDRHTEAGRRYEFTQILGEMRRSLVRELDYRQEASNLATLGENLAAFERIIVPEPVADYTTSRVLTMDYVRGRKITKIGPLARLEMDGEGLGEALFEAYLQQILVDGFFHADPHPGNVFLTDDRRLALIDVGMVGRITPDLQDKLLRLLLAISEARGEDAANLLVELGERRARFDNESFRREITHLVVEHHNVSAENLQIGRVVIELTRSAADNGLRVPSQLTLLGKTLLNLDQVGRTLDSVADNQLEVNVKLTNAATIMEGLQKIANRIATGAILASLIIGASMMMRVETSFRILGYPGYAAILFTAAVAGGFIMVADIVLHDRRSRRGQKR